jgi:predicted Fe-Mo cluster-binding NifX family protein
MLFADIFHPKPGGTMSKDSTYIAVAGTEGGAVDQHFGQVEDLLIYEGDRLIDRRGIAAHAQGDEDRRETILRMLQDCRALLVVKIGSAPQAKLAAAGIDATAAYAGQPIQVALAAYRATLQA